MPSDTLRWPLPSQGLAFSILSCARNSQPSRPGLLALWLPVEFDQQRSQWESEERKSPRPPGCLPVGCAWALTVSLYYGHRRGPFPKPQLSPRVLKTHTLFSSLSPRGGDGFQLLLIAGSLIVPGTLGPATMLLSLN